jgi:CTP:molybdopterin cytidylyltransferase MocA
VLMGAGTGRDVPALDGEAADVDTWEDLARLRGGDSPGTTPDHRT